MALPALNYEPLFKFLESGNFGNNTRLHRLRKNSGPGRKDVPQGLKPDVFSIIYGTVVP
jgi:hypothetical protein